MCYLRDFLDFTGLASGHETEIDADSDRPRDGGEAGHEEGHRFRRRL